MKGSMMLCGLSSARAVVSSASAAGEVIGQASEAAGTVSTVAENVSPLLGNQMESDVAITSHTVHRTKETRLLSHIIDLLLKSDNKPIRDDVIQFTIVQPVKSWLSCCCCAAVNYVEMSVPGNVRDAAVDINRTTQEGMILNALEQMPLVNRGEVKREPAFIAAMFIALISRMRSSRSSEVFFEFGFNIAQLLDDKQYKPSCYEYMFDKNLYDSKARLMTIAPSLKVYFKSLATAPSKINVQDAYRDMCDWSEALQGLLVETITGVNHALFATVGNDEGSNRAIYSAKQYQRKIPAPQFPILFLPSSYSTGFAKMINSNIAAFEQEDEIVKQLNFLYFFYKVMAHMKYAVDNRRGRLGLVHSDEIFDLLSIQVSFAFLEYIRIQPQHTTVFSKIVMRSYLEFMRHLKENQRYGRDFRRLIDESEKKANDLLSNNSTSKYDDKSSWAKACHGLFVAMGNPNDILDGIHEIIRCAVTPAPLACSIKPLVNLAKILCHIFEIAYENWYQKHHPMGEMASEYFNGLCTYIQKDYQSWLGKATSYHRSTKPVDKLKNLILNYDNANSQGSMINRATPIEYQSNDSFKQRNHQFEHDLRHAIKAVIIGINKGINSLHHFHFPWLSDSNKMQVYLIQVLIHFGFAESRSTDLNARLLPQNEAQTGSDIGADTNQLCLGAGGGHANNARNANSSANVSGEHGALNTSEDADGDSVSSAGALGGFCYAAIPDNPTPRVGVFFQTKYNIVVPRPDIMREAESPQQSSALQSSVIQ